MHEFTMLVRTLEPKLSMNDAQNYADHEILCLAREMVKRGFAKWKPTIDEAAVQEAIDAWTSDKNAAILKNMFGDNVTSLKSDTHKKMIRF
jgi:hypothetical protein